MKKILSLIICLILMFSINIPSSADVTTNSFVQLVHIEKDDTLSAQSVSFFLTLKEAVEKAQNGDVIEIFDNITVSSPILVQNGATLNIVSGTKREHSAIYGESAFEKTDQNATKRTVKKDFSGTLFTLGKNSKVTFENIILDGNGKGGTKGGLIFAQSGAELTVKRGVVFKNATLTENSFGGAIFAENGAKATVENTVFSGNSASCGKDIYLKHKTDVVLAKNVTANISLCGDMNGDFNVNLLDLVQIKKVFSNVPYATKENCSPDINCDGKKDSSDIAELILIILTF